MGLDLILYNELGDTMDVVRCTWIRDDCPYQIRDLAFQSDCLSAKNIHNLYQELKEYRNRFQYKYGPKDLQPPSKVIKFLEKVHAMLDEDYAAQFNSLWSLPNEDNKRRFGLSFIIPEIRNILINLEDDYGPDAFDGFNLATLYDEWQLFYEDGWERRGYYDNDGNSNSNSNSNSCNFVTLDYILEKLSRASLENWHGEWSY